MRRAALGVVVHTGWAHAVVVGEEAGAPAILHKARMALFDPPDIHGAAYHRAAELPLAEAKRSIAADERTAARVTAASLRAIVRAVEKRGHRLVAVRVVDKPRRPLPAELERILAAHPLLHAAEGALFRGAVIGRARHLIGDAAEVAGDDLPAAPTALVRAGAASGPPWSKEHKSCALAAFHALGGRAGRPR